MKCPKCHSENTDTSRFCSSCATRLTHDGQLPDSLTKTLETPFPLLTKGTLIAGRYRLAEEIGRGGMGVVYRAHDDSLARDVAIKVLPAEYASDAERLKRFEQEAQAAGGLNHPNILVVHDVGSQDNAPYIVTELLEGASLRQSLSGGALPLRKAIDYAIQVARGLAVAHEKGIVHRDLKPENLFVTKSGLVKILDFGLAKLRSAERPLDEAGPTLTHLMITEAGTVVGTAPYMSPEQVRGQTVDPRTDIFSFGAVLYEMLSGHRAFKGTTPADTLSAILKEDPRPLGELRGAVPPGLQQIVDRCLEKLPQDRFSSAHDLSLALEAVSTTSARTRRQAAPHATGKIATAAVESVRLLTSPFAWIWRSGLAKRMAWGIGGLIVLTVLVATSSAFLHSKRHAWVRNKALPELVRLADADDYWPAFRLARKIELIAPGDPTIEKLRPTMIGRIRRVFEPLGATLLAKPLVGDGDWLEIGTVTKDRLLLAPLGTSLFRLQAPGFEPREFTMLVRERDWAAGWIGGKTTLLRPGDAPEGMVPIWTPEPPDESGFYYFENLFGLAPAERGRVGNFFVDLHEVTNREFKRFVDAGGYERQEYWTEPFERDGQVLTWTEAMAFFKDGTGRPGPATWQVGAYEPGAEDLPVTGVSWYEAAAFAAFAGKRLPSFYHFAVASARPVAGDNIMGSNFNGKLAAVGSQRGSLNYWGLYDMAGNAREWCLNATGLDRFAQGGAANEPAYMFWDGALLPPFHRDAMTGFRCIKPIAPDPFDVRLDGPIAKRPPTDWSSIRGFPDDRWKTWQGLLSYDKQPLQEVTEWSDDLPSRRIEKVTFTAGYPTDDRVVAYLFLPDPAKWPPPWQPVMVVALAGFFTRSSQDGRYTGDVRTWDYLVKDGRAVVYPILKGAFERGGGQAPRTYGSAFWIQPVKDLFRTIDYLETRKDIRGDRVGFITISGACEGGVMALAAEPRIKAAVLLGGGLVGTDSQIFDRVGFSRHIASPVRLINGRSDRWEQNRMLGLFPTPDDRKSFVQLDGDHTLAGYEKDVMKLTLEWFDRFLGPVR